jgi:hypothetical protein
MKLTWVNEVQESGKPFDIFLRGSQHWSISEGQGSKEVFYEVKTSRKARIRDVPISANGENWHKRCALAWMTVGAEIIELCNPGRLYFLLFVHILADRVHFKEYQLSRRTTLRLPIPKTS